MSEGAGIKSRLPVNRSCTRIEVGRVWDKILPVATQQVLEIQRDYVNYDVIIKSL